MELLEFSRKSVQIEIKVYTGDAKGSFGWSGIEHPKSRDPKCFDLVNGMYRLADPIFRFDIKDVETIKTTDGKTYVGGDEGQSVYMGDAITIEDKIATSTSSESEYVYYRRLQNMGVTRVAVRADGRVSEMYKNDITYNEYCEQYKKSQATLEGKQPYVKAASSKYVI